MTLYIVRMKEGGTGRAGEFVGIYSAGSLDQLAWLVDQCVAPQQTEYAVLPAGGFYIGGKAPMVDDLYRLKDPEDDNSDMVASLEELKFDITEEIQHAISDELRFKPTPELDPTKGGMI
ncbi:MAG: hypothetical protein ABFD96_05850 [Armatimonadia bacterium]